MTVSRQDELEARVDALLAACGRTVGEFHKQLLMETVQLICNDPSRADIKMMARAMGEIRRGLEIFVPYADRRKVTIFGSARTRPEDPRYIQGRAMARALADHGFMVITGGGGGMMQAANEGAGEAMSFGININLPMEQKPNPVVAGSPRHFYCQYFFTRKLFFLKESSAVILTPGGFGTLDECFETLTLLQTGRNPPIPVVMLEAPGDDFWGPFLRSWVRRLKEDGLINSDDDQLLLHTDSVDVALDHIRSFYSNYHSFRYVGRWVLLRMLRPLAEEALERLNAEFSDVLAHGRIEQVFHWPEHDDEGTEELPRLRMQLDRHRMSVLPQIIRRANLLASRHS
ncbi:MAG: LOG family protein [Zetaproteobacteria bacterium]|nr:MAG: LOG family protein [Zetaproteobacteria bacterium]